MLAALGKHVIQRRAGYASPLLIRRVGDVSPLIRCPLYTLLVTPAVAPKFETRRLGLNGSLRFIKIVSSHVINMLANKILERFRLKHLRLIAVTEYPPCNFVDAGHMCGE